MNGKNLTYKERLKLEVLLSEGVKKSHIARVLGCSRQTVYNEIRRGLVEQIKGPLWEDVSVYYADAGERVTKENQSNKGRFCKYAYDDALMARLSSLLINEKYSPAAASVCLNCGICCGTIYNYIRAGRLDGVKLSALPCPRRKRNRRIRTEKKNPYRDGRLTIEDRPDEINARKEAGHYEIDTVYSSKKACSACLLVLTDRATRHEIIRLMPDRRATSTRVALRDIIKSYDIKTITSDNGSEFQGVDVGVPWYYCHAYHSWERGTNEVYNRFIRRWFPKNTDFSKVTPERVKQLEDWINSYPIKKRSLEITPETP